MGKGYVVHELSVTPTSQATEIVTDAFAPFDRHDQRTLRNIASNLRFFTINQSVKSDTIKYVSVFL